MIDTPFEKHLKEVSNAVATPEVNPRKVSEEFLKANSSVTNIARLYSILLAIKSNKGFSPHWIEQLDLITDDVKQEVRDHHNSIKPQLLKITELLLELRKITQIRTYCIGLSRYINNYITPPILEMDGTRFYDVISDFVDDQTIPAKGLSLTATFKTLAKDEHPLSRWSWTSIRDQYYSSKPSR